MNYGELKTQVREYLHRSSVTDTQIAAFTDKARRRIGRDLETAENEGSIGLSDWSGGAWTVALDERFSKVRNVLWVPVPGNIERYMLQSGSVSEISIYSLLTGDPQVYLLRNRAIQVYPKPADGTQVTVNFWIYPAELVSDTDTNEVLTTYPTVYLNACMAEANIWLRDFEGYGTFREIYQAEVRAANESAQKALYGAAPQIFSPYSLAAYARNPRI